MATISIVLPTFNGTKYICESINSILRQTYEDWELVIVDDCSLDNTLEIVQEYEKSDSRIQVIHNEVNMRLPGALNIGFEHTNGKYLTWTSDDNVYLPEALAVMAKRIESSASPMVCADEYAIDEEGHLKWNTALEYRDDLQCCKNTVGACFLYRREVLDNIGGYDTELFGVEDYDYWLRIKERYGRLERIGQALYKYRYHEASLSSTKAKMIRQSLIQLRKKHLDFILNELENKKELFYTFYYDMLEKRTLDQEIRERMLSACPELKNDTLGERGNYIIFGAGEYGLKALNQLKEHVIFFADNDPDKIGTYKNGKKILSFEKMKKLTSQYDIMIAVHSDNIYQVVFQLLNNGITQYCTWQTYMFRYSSFLENTQT